MNIKIGDLNQRIFLMEESDNFGPEPSGGEMVEVGSAWARVSNLHGEEYYAAFTLALEKELKFTIRYRSDITERTLIKFNNSIYNISFIDNIRYQNRFMEIRAKLESI